MSDLRQFQQAATSFAPKYIFRNQEWLGKENQVVGRDYIEKVVIIPDTIQVSSTTAIIDQIKQKHVKTNPLRDAMEPSYKPMGAYSSPGDPPTPRSDGTDGTPR